MNIHRILPKISSNFIEEYLCACGIANPAEYLHPKESNVEDPALYLNIDRVCEVVHQNLNKRIGILSDEDADGLCSSSMLYLFLKSLGSNPIPVFHTCSKAHGINAGRGEDKVKDNLPEMDLLLIPDASVDQETARQMFQKGIIVCELEHHDTQPRDYVITVNCQYQDTTNHHACGTMVTYKFIQRYCEIYNISVPNYSDLITIATVADVMDLRAIENRYYLNDFYENFSEEKGNNFVNALIKKYNKGLAPTPKDIGWRIAPLLNSVYRSGSRDDVKDMFYAMAEEKDADIVISQLARVKREQDKRVRETFALVQEKLNHQYKTLFAFIDNEDKSFSGLIANKILGAYNKPSFVLREINSTTYSGSYRSNIPLKTIINNSGLAQVSGHEEAAGIVVKKANLERLQQFLETLDLSATPDIEVTAEVKPKDITIDLCKEIDDNKTIWGKGVPSPNFFIHTTLTQDNISIFRKSTTTIKIQKDGLSCLMFFASQEDADNFTKYDCFDIEMVVSDCGVNEYNGFVSPQCVIQKYEIYPAQENDMDWSDLF